MSSERRVTELRCPAGPRRLFAKMVSSGEPPPVNADLNLIEMACGDCARVERKEDPEVFRILHRFDLAGTLVESVIVYTDGEEEILGGYS